METIPAVNGAACPACNSELTRNIVVSVDAAGHPLGGNEVWLRSPSESRWKLRAWYSQNGFSRTAALWTCVDCGAHWVTPMEVQHG